MTPPVGFFSRYEEATAFIASIENERRRAALEYALTAALVRRGHEPPVGPVREFDLLYFLLVIDRMFQSEAAIRLILDGDLEEMRWW